MTTTVRKKSLASPRRGARGEKGRTMAVVGALIEDQLLEDQFLTVVQALELTTPYRLLALLWRESSQRGVVLFEELSTPPEPGTSRFYVEGVYRTPSGNISLGGAEIAIYETLPEAVTSFGKALEQLVAATRFNDVTDAELRRRIDEARHELNQRRSAREKSSD
jgi:hypothetical protein